MARLFVLAPAALALPAGSAGFAGTNGRLLFTQELPGGSADASAIPPS